MTSAMYRNPNEVGPAPLGPSLADIDAITVSPSELSSALAGAGALANEIRVFRDAVPAGWVTTDSASPSALGFQGGIKTGVMPARRGNASYSTGGVFVFGEWNGWTYYTYNYASGILGANVERINTDTGIIESLTANPATGYYGNESNAPVGGIVGDYLYTFGGRTDIGSATNAARRMDLRTGLWETIAALPSYRGRQGAVVVGNYIYLFGGSDGSTQTSSVVKYNTVNGTYQTFNCGVNHIESHCVLLADGKILVALRDMSAFLLWNSTNDTLAQGLTGINDGVGSAFGAMFRLSTDTVVRAVKYKASANSFNGTIVEYNPATGAWTDTGQPVDVFNGWYMSYLPTRRRLLQPAAGAAYGTRQQCIFFDYAPTGRNVRAYHTGA